MEGLEQRREMKREEIKVRKKKLGIKAGGGGEKKTKDVCFTIMYICYRYKKEKINSGGK